MKRHPSLRARRRSSSSIVVITSIVVALAIAVNARAARGKADARGSAASRTARTASSSSESESESWRSNDNASVEDENGRLTGRATRRVRALPSGPCPLAPLAICEKLKYAVIEEDARARRATERCDEMGVGKKMLCALSANAIAAVSKAVNWGDAMFPRETRVVPLGGERTSASREPSYDHALASLCDLRMNKLCGNVVEQRVEHASKLEEMMGECEVAEKLHDAWELHKEMCEAKAVEIKEQRLEAEKDLKANEEAYAKMFGVKIGEKEKKSSSTKTTAAAVVGCRSEAFGDKPTPDDILIRSLRELRLRLLKTQENGGYCNKAAVDKIVNSKTEAARHQALKDLVLPGKYFETCDKVVSHLDFMINLLEAERMARSASQGVPFRSWCDDSEGASSSISAMKAEDKEALEKRKKMAAEATKISSKRQKHETKHLQMMEKLRSECSTQLSAAQKMYMESLERCEAHGPRLRQLREDIINVESRVEQIVPALDRTISAVAIVGITPEVASKVANAVSAAEITKFASGSKDLERTLGSEPLKTLRDMCSQAAILGAGGGKSDALGAACPQYQLPGPISCSQSCAAMEAATIGRLARRDKPFSLGILAGLALGYILFAKFGVHQLVNEIANAPKDKRE